MEEGFSYYSKGEMLGKEDVMLYVYVLCLYDFPSLWVGLFCRTTARNVSLFFYLS